MAIVEFDGLAPQTYCNVRGRLPRGTDAALGRGPAVREELAPADLHPEATQFTEDEAERLVVYALAPLEANHWCADMEVGRDHVGRSRCMEKDVKS